VMPLDRMPSLSLGILVPAGAVYDTHHHWHTDTGEPRASVGFDAGGHSHAHIQAGRPARAGRRPPGRRRPGRPAGCAGPCGCGGGWLMWADSPDCPACASGWHSRCRWPEQVDDGDGELVERCCDGLLIARRRRPLWTRGVR
jgi:hypothetical protein